MFTIQTFENVESTMDIARGNLVHGLVIQALEQSSARGRRGNQWSAPKGNLYKSIVLKPERSRSEWGQLSFVIAVALGEACAKIGINNYQLKWPNDILIQDKKLAGILIEVEGDYVIVGVGVNIKLCPDGCSKLNDYSDLSVSEFRDIFLKLIEKYYHMWLTDGFAPIRDAWMKKAYRLGEEIQARLPHNIYKGVFEDLDAQGILLLRENDGSLRKINSGEILHVPSN